jgi:hypothetical protein
MSGYELMNLTTGDFTTTSDIIYKVYVLPKDTDIYRGDTRLYNDFNKPQGTPEKGAGEDGPNIFTKENNFFTMFQQEAKMYGVPYKYTTKETYNLLAIDNHDENTTFFNNAPDNIKTILSNNYGWSTNKRNSDGDEDQKVADYICSLGLDGYASQPMESVRPRPNLPSEIMLCDSINKVDNQGIMEPTKEEINSHLDKYKNRTSAAVKTKVRPSGNSSSRVFDSPGPRTTTGSVPFAGFGSPTSPGTPTGSVPFAGFGSPTSPGTPNINTNLFGFSPRKGGKRTNKKRKTKRSRKTHKKRKSKKTRKTKK